MSYCSLIWACCILILLNASKYVISVRFPATSMIWSNVSHGLICHGAQFLNTLLQLSAFTSARAPRTATEVLVPAWKAKETAVVVSKNGRCAVNKAARGWDGMFLWSRQSNTTSGNWILSSHLPHSSFCYDLSNLKQMVWMCWQVSISKANLNLGSLYGQ